ncbi:unnamed protein product [Acanthoscelides obtectus]|uniref:Uncharacterized protein n=1 Tax=Acanthoscelides obtectus TaxID=200917 RepID=A0A9P0M2S7_ACAOB|nr:unnamed protein product [Acanthoscelides obtectus]CAK1679517.1 hypothetical protein AOBTE_LOCUS32316 [Acanthoscelides obtectus]
MRITLQIKNSYVFLKIRISTWMIPTSKALTSPVTLIHLQRTITIYLLMMMLLFRLMTLM